MSENNVNQVQPASAQVPAQEPKRVRVGFIFLSFVPVVVLLVIQTISRYSGRPDSKGFNRLLNFLAYFHGNMPVEVLFEADKSVLRLDNMCNIAPEEGVLKKLAELVGEDNIEMM